MHLRGYRLLLNGSPISSRIFRRDHIAPLVRARKSYQIMQGLEYMIFACGENEKSRGRLESGGDEDDDSSFLYEDYGMKILIQCTFCDEICTVNVIECSLSSPQSLRED